MLPTHFLTSFQYTGSNQSNLCADSVFECLLTRGLAHKFAKGSRVLRLRALSYRFGGQGTRGHRHGKYVRVKINLSFTCTATASRALEILESETRRDRWHRQRTRNAPADAANTLCSKRKTPSGLWPMGYTVQNSKFRIPIRLYCSRGT